MIQRAGPCVIKAAQRGDAYFNPATREATVNVAKANQSISFEPLPSGGTYGGGPFTVSARASSGLAVTFAASGACTSSGAVVSIQAAGVCTVSANQSGGENWMSASTVVRTLTIAKANQQLRVAVPDPIRYGGAPVKVDATSSSSLAVGLTAAGPCILTGGMVKAKGFIGTDVCTITATQPGDANISPATPLIQRVTVVGLSWTCCRVMFAPPFDFCSYFACIANFGNSAGYVMQCRDGFFSTAGGRSGSCSGHGGNARAIYMP